MRFCTFIVLLALVGAFAMPSFRPAVQSHLFGARHYSIDYQQAGWPSVHGDFQVDRLWDDSPGQRRLQNQLLDAQDYPFSNRSIGFHWPRLWVVAVVFIGGTTMLRRIFRGTSCVSNQATSVKYRTQPPPLKAAAPDRICSRADCRRANPPVARYCRHCGSVLKDA